jgi:hypothetical protein
MFHANLQDIRADISHMTLYDYTVGPYLVIVQRLSIPNLMAV